MRDPYKRLTKEEAAHYRKTAFEWFKLGTRERQTAIQLLLQDGTLRFTDHFELTDRKMKDD